MTVELENIHIHQLQNRCKIANSIYKGEICDLFIKKPKYSLNLSQLIHLERKVRPGTLRTLSIFPSL